jgi:uncharacterized membrane protein YphA (DoxX/SURF4 family)
MKRLPYLVLLIRLLLGFVFVVYGVVKLFGGQYYYGDFVIDSKTVDGTFMVWAFFGWSKVYALFTGFGELLAGVLLLIPRTRTAGAVALFPVTLNITVMTFAFGFPGVKYASLIYTLLCGFLLLYDLPKLKLIFLSDAKTDALLRQLKPEDVVETASTTVAAPRGKLVKRLAIAAVLLPITFFLVNAAVASLTPGPEGKALDACVAQGWKKESLELKRSRYGGGTGINRQGFVLFEVKGTTPPKFVRVEVNRPISFVDWQILKISEETSSQ